MKQTVLILWFTIIGGYAVEAQNTLAKFKFEDAEKAYYENNFEECIGFLNETEKILGEKAPNILHLRILAGNKLLEADPNHSYDRILGLRLQCDDYLTNFDIPGLEEKYRDVYEVSENLSNYPESREAFNKMNMALDDANNFKKEIIENYLTAIGGRDKVAAIQSIYFIREVDGSKSKGHIKIMAPDKMTSFYSKGDDGDADKRKGAIMVLNGNRYYFKFREKDGGSARFDFSPGMLDIIRVNTFPELHFLDDDYEFNLVKTENGLHHMYVSYPNGIHESRYYDVDTHLLRKVEYFGFYLNTFQSFNSGPATITIIEFVDYQPVNGIKFPFTQIEKNVFNNEELITNHQFINVYINEFVDENDFK